MNSDKSGFFQSERTIVTAIAEAVGLPARRGGFSRHPLSLLVEAADDTCYGLLDLEDAVEMEILPLHDVMETLLHAFAPKDRNAFRPARHERSHRVVFSRVRGKIFRQAIDAAAEAFLQNYDAILAGDFDRELLEVAAGRGNRGAMTVLEAKRRAQREVFSYSHKASIELASFAVIAQLLDAFSLAALQFSKDLKRHSSKPSLDSKSAMLLGMLGDHQPNRKNAPAGETWTAYQSVRRAIDYVAGMTDEFAIRVCRQLSGNVDLRA
jgi:dGTPase